ncbi:3505_t:CDS:2 [Acaulospora colombiana]|uniref:3505_t:CDS:1 n=1 Tax=Acaulospora colombiana TaxID=27376 RepID=A0ACA9MTP6_9GLOM|nr:3505_t:CDS:2 [Acaulospora colombiana]
MWNFDFSSTSIVITRDTKEKLVVSIKRVDDLVDGDGFFLAKRISAVVVDFELKDDHLLLDSVPVKLGVNNVHVINAEFVPAGVKEEDIRKYNENFAIGLVKVEVNTKVESTIPFRKINISIRIIEIDGVKVSSNNTVEKFWEFKILETEDGDQNSEILPIPPVDDNTNTRIFLSSLSLTAIFGVIFLLVSSIANSAMTLASPNKFSKYQKVLQDEGSYGNMHGEVEKVIFVADDHKLKS